MDVALSQYLEAQLMRRFGMVEFGWQSEVMNWIIIHEHFPKVRLKQRGWCQP
jgi:hypothetical protein